MNNLKSNLAVLMAERKIKSVTQLQTITGLSRNAINRVLNDEDEKIQGTTLLTLVKLCDALNCSLAELIEYQNDKVKDIDPDNKRLNLWDSKRFQEKKILQ